MKLIVGLGNPGKEYEKTRHNIGFKIIDNYLENINQNIFKEDFSSKYIKLKINNEDVIFQKPLTYMNLSGNAISSIAKYYKIKNEDILIIYDDMSLNIGEIKIKNKGSSAGHNGIKSIISHLGEQFNRLKIGIGKPKNKDVINYVLGNFSKEESEILDSLNDHFFKIIDSFINNTNLEKIVSKFTIKNKKKEVKNQIQLAKIKDIKDILEIKEMALNYQIENNNIQWNKNYPNEEDLLFDINEKSGYIVKNKDKIIAYACLNIGKDPMYQKYFDGEINNEIDYSSIHRVMVHEDFRNQNVASNLINSLINISFKKGINCIRIDTKEENLQMKKVIEKLNFKRIAKVYAPDNTERTVYEYKK